MGASLVRPIPGPLLGRNPPLIPDAPALLLLEGSVRVSSVATLLSKLFDMMAIEDEEDRGEYRYVDGAE